MTLMAEPVQGGDETVAQDLGKTVDIPSSIPTDSVGLAWSGNDEDDRGTPGEPAAAHESWRSTWRRAGALVAAGLALAGAIILASWLLTRPSGGNGSAAQTPSKSVAQPPAALPTPKVSAPAAPTGSAPAAASPSIASTPDQDKKYVQALNDRGISFANPDAAIYNGKMVCQDIQRGVTVQQIADAFRASNPALGNSANAYVAISVHAYCPQNGDLVAGF
jgi:Protein of unknown function (DUF732)